jgi:hypothetical protein
MDDIVNVTRPNAPAIDLAAALDPASLSAWIEWSYASHAAEIGALLERFVAFTNVTSDGIRDDFIAGHAADFAKDLKGAVNALDGTRTRIKKPVLHAQRLIDGEAKALSDRVMAAVAEVEARVTTYLRAKEVEIRRAAELEAARLAAEAERLITEAQQSGTKEDAETAWNTMDEADAAQKLADAKALELTRTRGLGGALTALKDNWVWSLEDITKVPAHLLQVNDAAVRLAIRQGAREVPGLRIWNDTKMFVR